MKPEVSVIIPAYDTAPYIGDAVESVFRQTFGNHEVIVVNDGSPDTEEMEEVLRPYLDRIVYIRQENQGVSAARNAAIRVARAPMIAMLDSDDIWEPEYLATQMTVLEQDRTIDLIYPNAVYFGDCEEAGREFMELCPSEGEVTLKSLVRKRCNVMSSVTARREILLKAGLFDEALRSSVDFDLWLRVLLQGGRITYHRRPIVWYRRRKRNLTSDMVEHLPQVLRVVDKMLAHHAITAGQEEELRRARRRCSAALRGRDRLAKGGASSQGRLCAHHQPDAWIRGLLLGRRRRRGNSFYQRLRA
jgi:glycosyltransferase involved in cell wall biosynthesis